MDRFSLWLRGNFFHQQCIPCSVCGTSLPDQYLQTEDGGYACFRCPRIAVKPGPPLSIINQVISIDNIQHGSYVAVVNSGYATQIIGQAYSPHLSNNNSHDSSNHNLSVQQRALQEYGGQVNPYVGPWSVPRQASVQSLTSSNFISQPASHVPTLSEYNEPQYIQPPLPAPILALNMRQMSITGNSYSTPPPLHKNVNYTAVYTSPAFGRSVTPMPLPIAENIPRKRQSQSSGGSSQGLNQVSGRSSPSTNSLSRSSDQNENNNYSRTGTAIRSAVPAYSENNPPSVEAPRISSQSQLSQYRSPPVSLVQTESDANVVGRGMLRRNVELLSVSSKSLTAQAKVSTHLMQPTDISAGHSPTSSTENLEMPEPAPVHLSSQDVASINSLFGSKTPPLVLRNESLENFIGSQQSQQPSGMTESDATSINSLVSDKKPATAPARAPPAILPKPKMSFLNNVGSSNSRAHTASTAPPPIVSPEPNLSYVKQSFIRDVDSMASSNTSTANVTPAVGLTDPDYKPPVPTFRFPRNRSAANSTSSLVTSQVIVKSDLEQSESKSLHDSQLETDTQVSKCSTEIKRPTEETEAASEMLEDDDRPYIPLQVDDMIEEQLGNESRSSNSSENSSGSECQPTSEHDFTNKIQSSHLDIYDAYTYASMADLTNKDERQSTELDDMLEKLKKANKQKKKTETLLRSRPSSSQDLSPQTPPSAPLRTSFRGIPTAPVNPEPRSSTQSSSVDNLSRKPLPLSESILAQKEKLKNSASESRPLSALAKSMTLKESQRSMSSESLVAKLRVIRGSMKVEADESETKTTDDWD